MHELSHNMEITESTIKLRNAVNKAIEDGILTREEYDNIINIAVEDGNVDKYNQAILKEFHQMIYDKDIKFKPI